MPPTPLPPHKVSEQKEAELREKSEVPIHLLTAPSGDQVVVRVPKRAEWARFKATGDDRRRRQEQADHLFAKCLIYPEGPGWEELLDARPGLQETFFAALMDLTGVAAKESDIEKKAL